MRASQRVAVKSNPSRDGLGREWYVAVRTIADGDEPVWTLLSEHTDPQDAAQAAEVIARTLDAYAATWEATHATEAAPTREPRSTV